MSLQKAGVLNRRNKVTYIQKIRKGGGKKGTGLRDEGEFKTYKG